MSFFKKPLFFILLSFVAIGCCGFFGLRTFVRNIYDSRDCEWANIDHIEIRAKVNIPETKGNTCNYDDDKKVRTVVFDLDDTAFDMKEYSGKHGYSAITELPANLYELDPNAPKFEDRTALFWREGDTETTTYKMLLDAKHAKLWVYLKYKS